MSEEEKIIQQQQRQDQQQEKQVPLHDSVPDVGSSYDSYRENHSDEGDSAPPSTGGPTIIDRSNLEEE